MYLETNVNKYLPRLFQRLRNKNTNHYSPLEE